MRVAEIQALGLAVDFHRDAAFGRGADDGGHVHRGGLALQETPAGRVAEHIHPRTVESTQDPVGHMGLILREVRMHGSDDEIELGQTVVGEIEAAVVQDVALDAGEQRQALESSVQRTNAGRVRRCSAVTCSKVCQASSCSRL